MSDKVNLVIFEGIDGSGKTTLMRNFENYIRTSKTSFENDLFVDVVNTSDSIPAVRDFLKTTTELSSRAQGFILNSLFVGGEIGMLDHETGTLYRHLSICGEGDIILMDRYFPSLIYNVMDDVLYREIENTLLRMMPDNVRVIMVYCDCIPDIAKRRIQSRGDAKEYYEDTSNLIGTYRRYQILIDNVKRDNKYDIIQIDSSYATQEEMLTDLISECKNMKIFEEGR